MKLFNRYSDEMLQTLATQSLLSVAINSLLRGLAFTVFIQLLSFASGFGIGSIFQMLLQLLIFSLFIFSFDVIEKYASEHLLKRKKRL